MSLKAEETPELGDKCLSINQGNVAEFIL